MPWAEPDTPSIQLASLKAHVDTRLQGRCDCSTYSAFFSILHDFRGRAYRKFFRDFECYDEYLYLLLYLRRFGPSEFRRKPAVLRMLKSLRKPCNKPLSLPLLDGLERSTRRFLQCHVAPNLIAKGLNLVGFTLNYSQVYSSLYAAEYLRRRFPERHFLFVYGGSSASLPTVYELLTLLGVPGIVVAGEGETKLELLVRTIQALPFSKAPKVLTAVAGLDPGIIMIGEKVDLSTHNPVCYATQVESLNELALPDYDEYFGALRQACADEQTYNAFREVTYVLVEGSRGCFSKCDFCGQNRTWRGFRKRSAEQVVRDALALAGKYRTSRIDFADNVCDTWAEDYARMLIQQGIQVQSCMELRSNHPERFWTTLALAGINSVQVGVEAISSPLLKTIGKGTRVVQNLAAHKYLNELGVRCNNNLITHHPASALADIEETCRILEQIPHLDPFNVVQFELHAGSPFYEGLSKEERARLRLTRSFRLPPDAARYALELKFQLPKRLSPGREVTRAWSEFARQYRRELARRKALRPQPRLEVERVAPDTLRITDARHGKVLSYDFSAAAARIYDTCHCGLKLDEIVQATGLSLETVKAEVEQFLKLKLVLRVDDYFLSLATRPRDELVRRYFVTQ
jgi:radical SAM superfamily enzyme YgiQ (UPF0313 family)